MNIEIIAGSPRQNSVTFRLALHLKQEIEAITEHQVGIVDIREWNLPLLQNVFNSVENTPEQYKPLAERMFAADAFILVTPEYNGSYSPAMQNLLDYFPKQARKAFGLAPASVGGMGGIRASQQLLLLVPGLFGIASPHMLITPFIDKKFDEAGNLLDPGFKKSVDNFLQEFLWLAETLQTASLYK
jgi:NAD(P)H-dependent FMN reductase